MSSKSFIFSLVMLLVSLFAVGIISSRSVPVVVQTNLEKLPTTISGYSATDDTFPESVYQELNADKHVYRHYRDRNGKQVDLYIGYYGTAKGGRTGHNPYACLPSAGWAIVEAGKATITSPEDPRGVVVNFLRAQKDGVSSIMFHWYQSGSRVMTTGFEMNMQRFLGRVFRNHNDGAFVRISTFAEDGKIPEAKQIAGDFAGNTLALLPSYWPVEK